MPAGTNFNLRRCPRCGRRSVQRELVTTAVAKANGEPKNGGSRCYVHYLFRCLMEPCNFSACSRHRYYESLHAAAGTTTHSDPPHSA